MSSADSVIWPGTDWVTVEDSCHSLCLPGLLLPEAQSLDTYINTLHKAAKLPFTHMIQSHEPDPVPKRRLWDYLDLAEHLDFEAGALVPAPFGHEMETRICTRNGIHYDDREHPGFAAIMISRKNAEG